MATKAAPSEQPQHTDFATLAAIRKSTGFWEDFFLFLRTNKKWWLTPVLVVLLLFTVVVLLGSTAAAPFIYTLF